MNRDDKIGQSSVHVDIHVDVDINVCALVVWAVELDGKILLYSPCL